MKRTSNNQRWPEAPPVGSIGFTRRRDFRRARTKDVPRAAFRIGIRSAIDILNANASCPGV
jgi:hypothetical protein